MGKTRSFTLRLESLSTRPTFTPLVNSLLFVQSFVSGEALRPLRFYRTPNSPVNQHWTKLNSFILIVSSLNPTLVELRNNFWQRISWLSQRWRTQRNAIRNVNCKLRESSNLWTHIALCGIPQSMPVWESSFTSSTQLWLDWRIWTFTLERVRRLKGIVQKVVMATPWSPIRT